MSPRARAFIGVITTAFFAFAGAVFLAERQTMLGAVFVVLACLRGLLAIQQFRAARNEEPE